MIAPQYLASVVFSCTLLLGIMLKGRNDAAHMAAWALAFAFCGAYAGSQVFDLGMTPRLQRALVAVGVACTIIAAVLGFVALFNYTT